MSVKKTISVDNLTCPDCIVEIIENFEKIKFVKKIYIDYDKGEFTIEGNNEFTPKQIEKVKNALLISNHSHHKIESDHDECECHTGHHHEEHHECDHDHDHECSCHTHHEEHYNAKSLRNLLNNEHVLKDEDEFIETNIQVEKKEIVIKYQNNIEQYNVVSKVVSRIGESLDEKEQKKHEEEHEHGCCCGEEHEEEELSIPKLIVFILGVIAFITAFVLEIIFDLNIYIYLTYIGAYLLIGYDILWKSIKGIIHGDVFNENLLMVIASAGALAIKECREALLVILLYKIGEFLQDRASDKSRDQIKELMEMKVDKVTLSTGEVIDISEVEVGDIISVKVGERIPLDGVITKGSTDVDMKALTGESRPVFIDQGTEIMSGAINLTKVIEVEVTKKENNSTISKVMKLVEEASTQKSKKEEFIHKFAKIYTPIVIGIALIVGLVKYFGFGSSINDSLNAVFTILVISCPCALVISIPLAYYAGIGRLSSNGILTKGGSYIDSLATKGYFAFDKTGTLTKGNFKVSEVYASNGKTKEEVLEIIAKVEAFSTHPIAQSILSTVSDKEINSNYEVEEIGGKGLKVVNAEEEILVGSDVLMKENNIDIVIPNSVGTILYLAIDKVFYGSVVIIDEIKESSVECINYLNELGNKTVMLTGDNEDVANDVAKKLGLTEYHAGLLPKNKYDWIKDNIKDNNVVYVGDGINDSPSLRLASVGVAMGKNGSDSAKECADIVIIDDKLDRLVEAIKVSKFVQRIVIENITFALLVKVVALIIGALGLLGSYMMILAVFSDVGVCLIAILNSMRILKYKKK